MIVNGKQVQSLEQHIDNPDYRTEKQQVFIIGCKGIPASYGGFETFVENLTLHQKSKNIRYHVSNISDNKLRYEYNGSKCFNVDVLNIGAAKSVFYDLKALRHCIDYCRKRPSIEVPVFYILACRIGPFIGAYKRRIKKLGGVLLVNPDGHEWKRSKWPWPVRLYWKFSERLMVKHADLVICDSINIEKYILYQYNGLHPTTRYIAYGSDTRISALEDDDPLYLEWLRKHDIREGEYYLVVCRLVPENNFETIIREFMNTGTTKDLVIISTGNRRFMRKLRKLGYENDGRVKFVGTVYDHELLKKIREKAYAYIHGHEVGGTNPSLLEAMQCTSLNLLYDVGFNREVAGQSALYWNKERGNLRKLLVHAEDLSSEEIAQLGNEAKVRIDKAFRWDYIIDQYERLFIDRGETTIENSGYTQLP